MLHLKGLSNFQKVTIMLRSNSDPVSYEDTEVSLRFLGSFIKRLSLLSDFTTFIDMLSVENMIYVEQVVVSYLDLNHLHLNIPFPAIAMSRNAKRMLEKLVGIIRCTRGAKKVVIVSSANSTFRDCEMNYFSELEKLLISGRNVQHFMFKRVEDVQLHFYRERESVYNLTS